MVPRVGVTKAHTVSVVNYSFHTTRSCCSNPFASHPVQHYTTSGPSYIALHPSPFVRFPSFKHLRKAKPETRSKQCQTARPCYIHAEPFTPGCEASRRKNNNGGSLKSTVYVHHRNKKTTRSNGNHNRISKKILSRLSYPRSQRKNNYKVPAEILGYHRQRATKLESSRCQSDVSLSRGARFYQTKWLDNHRINRTPPLNQNRGGCHTLHKY